MTFNGFVLDFLTVISAMKTKRRDQFKSRHASGDKRKRRAEIRQTKQKQRTDSHAQEGLSDSDAEHAPKRVKIAAAAPPEATEDGEEAKLSKNARKIMKQRHKEGKLVRQREEKAKARPFTKNLTRKSPAITDESAAEKLREELNVVVLSGTDCPQPVMDLSDPALPPQILQYMQAQKFTKPSPVQSQCWPICLSGRDAVVLAPAGSGKTLGYLLPCIPHIKAQKKVALGDGPIALVLVPTRELAKQVAAVCKPMLKLFGIRSISTYGGKDRDGQAESLRAGVEILISTPGRLLDLLAIKATNMGRITVCVLDEADKMLDMGFGDQLYTLRNQLRPDRQTLLFSATFEKKLAGLAAEWLPHNRIEIQLSTEALTISPTITQIVHVCAEHKKPRKLLRFLEKLREKEKVDGQRNRGRVLVFCNRIKKVKAVAAIIKGGNHRCAALHGELKQAQRESLLREFSNGKVPILVSTDVAARGIHVTRLPVVVNYDFPTTMVQYVHRVGRTGRQGEAGTAFSFFTRNLAPLAAPMAELLKHTSQWVDPNLVQLSEELEKEGGVVEGNVGEEENEEGEAELSDELEPADGEASESDEVVSEGESVELDLDVAE